MSDDKKEPTILISKEVGNLSCAEIPTEFLGYCFGLIDRLNNYVGGISARFGVAQGLYCDIWWKGKFVATVYSHLSTDKEFRVKFCDRPTVVIVPRREMWDKGFRPAFLHLLREELEALKTREYEIEHAIPELP